MVDVNWLINNLGLHVADDRVSLALDRRAIYAFDDFMVARYHMFVMVYFHHKSVACEEMLKRFILSPGCDFELPTDLEAYLYADEIFLHTYLRSQEHPLARAIVRREPWKRVIELHGTPEEVNATWAIARLAAEGVDTLSAGSIGKLSRYTVFGQKREGAPPIYVIDSAPRYPRRVIELTDATAIFRRYQEERLVARVYVHPTALERARGILGLEAVAE
jgi:hypothetical protein